MTYKKKLEKLKKLADAMYYAAQHLTTDASKLHIAMEEYHQFIIHKYFKKEPVSEDEIEKQFKAGDVVVYVSRQPAYSGLYLLGNPNDLSIGYSNANEPYQIALRNCTVASEDERKQFMRELDSNGYKWNEDTLRIEKEEPVKIDRHISKMADEFAEREYETNGYERQWLSKGYYHGYMDACKGKLKEPVSDDLVEAAMMHYKDVMERKIITGLETANMTSFKAGAKWQKEQMMVKAVDVEVKVDAGGYPYIPQLELYDYDKDVPLAKEGDKYKVILIKEK